MKDAEFAAAVRSLFGKETNTEALTALRQGGEQVRQAQIEADKEALKQKLLEIKDRVSSYFREKWAEIQNADEAVVVVDDAFTMDADDDGAEAAATDTPLAAPEVVRNETEQPES